MRQNIEAEKYSRRDEETWKRLFSHSFSSSFLPLYDLLDVVILIPSLKYDNRLIFLEDWKKYAKQFHLIIVMEDESSSMLQVPSWADYELYTYSDVIRSLGNKSWIFRREDGSLRSFGYLVSDKRFIYTFHYKCVPYQLTDGQFIDPITFHLQNFLHTPIKDYRKMDSKSYYSFLKNLNSTSISSDNNNNINNNNNNYYYYHRNLNRTSISLGSCISHKEKLSQIKPSANVALTMLPMLIPDNMVKQ